VWDVHFSYVVSGSASTTATTAGPGQVITIDGGANAPAGMPGQHQDPADFYGIILVVLAIAVALFATRWLFGRRPR
jgi:hypothetical protein